MKTFFGNRLLNAITIAVVTVLIIVVLSIWQYQRIRDTGVVIRHTSNVLAQSQEVQRMTSQFEVNVKNFLLTGDSSFLDTAGRIAAPLPAAIDSLRLLVTDDPGQRGRIDSLQFYVSSNRDVLERAMRLSKGGEFGGAAALINAEARTGYSHHIQSTIEQLETGQRRILDIRRGANQQKATQLQWALWCLIGAVVVLALFIFRKIRIDLAHERSGRLSSEDKYKMLFDKSPLPKWIYDEATMRFLEVNGTAMREYGYTREEFLGMTIADIRPREDIDRLVKDVESIRDNPLAYRNSQWRHIKKNGEVIDVDVTAHAIDFDGRQARMVVVNDITDRRRYEEQLRRLNTDLAKRAAELSSSNSELERFAYIASHDLQEPLRMVSSFLQLLQRKYNGQLDAKADQYIHYAVDGAERMKALIMDLLEYSRVGTGKENFVPVDTSVVMQEVGDIFREKIISARAKVEIGDLPVVVGDKVQLTQLFQNLLSNALKYHSETPPVIRIGSKDEGACWRFSVEDNGIGIDPQFFDKIFIIFQRLHNKTDYSGTGIGLAICKKIVERHGGRIWVESSPQHGSAFHFTIHKKG
ncbi:sensor histidine kinase [Puia sp.]|uniref:sensor histidine kinase n=1 Tax=Puia sp. TaxID=2045100 RepID=UPI002F3FA926